MSEKDMEKLVRSLDEFGFVEPIVVNTRTGLVVGGHQRLEAAGPQTTKEITDDLPSVGRATYGRLRVLHRRGLVGRVSVAPSTTVLWWHNPRHHPNREADA